MYSAVCFLFLPTGSTYEDEQKKQETNVIELQTVIDESEQQTFNIKCFLRLVKGYTEPDRLTSEILRMFVEKIVIHKPTKENCRRIHPHPEQDEIGALEFFLTWYDNIAGKVLLVGDRDISVMYCLCRFLNGKIPISGPKRISSKTTSNAPVSAHPTTFFRGVLFFWA